MKNNDIFKLKANVEVILRDAQSGRIKSIDRYHNLFVTTGKSSVADCLRGSSNKGVITYCALGTGTNAPASGDVALQTELFRKLISTRSVTNNTALFETFYTTSEGNGTLREAGLFGDAATGSSATGTLFCRVNITRTKTSSDTLTIRWYVTVG
jgi:hypothetical protein